MTDPVTDEGWRFRAAMDRDGLERWTEAMMGGVPVRMECLFCWAHRVLRGRKWRRPRVVRRRPVRVNAESDVDG